jgi:aryl-alcohol dehydrogenase-like predicted oxidoreductase
VEARTLGGTGLVVTPIGLGLAALGRPAYINLGRAQDLGRKRSVEEMEGRCRGVLDAAWSAGVRYFDAARSYGYAERFLGLWLRDHGVDPDDVTVGSKWGYTCVGGWSLDAEVHEVKDHSLEALTRQYAQSREILGAQLDLYQIHSATVDTGVLQDAAVLEELAALAEGGVVVGLSVSGPQQKETLLQALEADVGGINPFSCVQATYNLLEQSVEPALAEAHAAGWGVIVKEVLANGRLTSSNREPGFADKRTRLEGVALARGVPLDALAIAWALSHDFVDVVLSGAVNAEQLSSNLLALSVPSPIESLGWPAETPRRYWSTRSSLPWQ